MEEKKELNEFLLGDDNKSSSKPKKIFLMIIVAIIVILILLIVFWKITREEPKEESMTTDSSIQKMDDSVLSSDSHFDNENFENMPIDDMSKTDEESKFDKIVQDIKAKQLAGAESSKEQNKMSEDHLTSSQDKENVVPEISKENNVAQDKNTQEKKPVMKKDNSVVKASMPTKKENKPQKQTIVKPKQNVVPRAKNGSVASSGYYLQVGAFNKTPNKEFLNKISKFNYRTQTSMLNGQTITKYLVGPYSSKIEASKDLLEVTNTFTKPIQIQIK
ncbi:SPOR domain-containing protein [Helicobacter sp. 13S00477-4]|uniref:SPOR domain-containing protein n=1 Tax=Helicobacter sp. 13S00477-4 TaxID=1905759 RepID=UPI000BA55486|nr:SPOR domain-containing protein [Helicobacter sp. 13S00477-4]PAF52035.1 hypothetical protein BKH44_03955 [Helicobacter sp. 13S00477-4]